MASPAWREEKGKEIVSRSLLHTSEKGVKRAYCSAPSVIQQQRPQRGKCEHCEVTAAEGGIPFLSKLVSHFFLLPHSTPALISCSMRGKRVRGTQEGGCCAAYRRRARTIAEPLTVQPRESEASWLTRRRKRFVSWVRVRERIIRCCFGGLVLARAIR
jgi:hypothetical protein